MTDGNHIRANPHEAGTGKHSEHAAAFDLVRHEMATHVAVNDGSWFDPATWQGGVVPADDARVVIADGIQVSYDDVSDARLFTVRVDGQLNFATDTDTRMVVDTMVVDSRGTLTVGTEDTPVEAGVTADIVIANNGAIDTAWDPQLLSRGVISHGSLEMHGQEKTTDLKVATDPMAGDTSLTLAEAPAGWQVGDTIVLAGTRYDGYKWDNDIRAVRHHEPEDEVRTITAIEGDTVHFDAPLVHDHDTPRTDLKASVANYSRNITVATENPETAAVHERGHVMFMHSGDVDVRYAAFHELGRTDKSADAVPVGFVDEIAPDTNVQGRYAFHFHRSGLEDQENPAMAVGNAVFGSPGWGFVHHDSNAVLHDNATYNTFGAGFVAETGNETGSWTDNIAIYAKGVSWAAPKNVGDFSETFDLGRTGDGFWFQGRMVESADNIAASVNHGFVYMHRGKGMLEFDASVFDFPEALGWSENASPGDAPILSFRDNEAFAAKEGLHVVKANPNQGHDIHSHLKDFTAWSVRSGAHIEYTSHYILEGFDVVGKDPVKFSNPLSGISLGKNTTDVTIIDAKVAGFDKGITAAKSFTFDFDPEAAAYAVIDAKITDTGTPYVGLTTDNGEILTAEDLNPGRFEIRLDGALTYKAGYPDPDARKVAISGVKIDSLGEIPIPAGSDSYDADREKVIKILETDGFYEAADGTRYFILEGYYSDRGTGEIHKVGHLVKIDENVPLQNQYSPYKNAVFAGPIDLDSAAPITTDDHAKTQAGSEVVIDLLANDNDPDGDEISIDGIVQPENGRVFANGDGTVTYRPDLDFTGSDEFKYWAADGSGNFSSAQTSIEVVEAPMPGETDERSQMENEMNDFPVSDGHNPHEAGTGKHSEHAAAFDLVRHEMATHVAVNDGSWFDPATWQGGVVPADDARVVIADGIQVSYDDVSDARLFTVRVDGQLNFATDTDTRMVVDTMVVDSRGTLTVGTEDTPVEAGVTADIVIANNGAIDTAWDPQLLSRGVISHGSLEMHGQEKTTDLKVATDPMAGDTSLTLAEAPAGWQVGDTIVLAGTRYDGYKWDNDIRAVRHHEPEDEVRTITAIEGDTVHFDAPLVHDHDTPRTDLKASVANYSRNITVATENPETAAVHERGHVMFMHSGDVDVRYAAFHELGRTDKSADAVPVGFVDEIAPDTNVQGRYAFHFHRSGLEDQENPAMAVGNAVFGSPGWGFVHHDSNAVLHDNATYNTFGAGFVAETGNETGSWTDNIAIYAKGVSWAAPKNVGDFSETFDLGRTGDGFWFQGRMVESADNIAASVNHGFVYMHRGKGMLEFDASVFDFPEALGWSENASPGDAPILSFRDNEAFAAKEGLHVVKANPNQGHDIHSHLKDFTAWSVRSGAHIEYTSHYILEGFDVVGKDPVKFSNPLSGISLGKNTTDVTIIDAKVAGFDKGITAAKSFTFDFDPEAAAYAVIDAKITDTGTPYVGLTTDNGEILTAEDLNPGRFEIRLDGALTYKAGYPDPDARKVAISGVKIDSLGEIPIPAGSDSYDADREKVIKILETDGFYEAADGTRYFILEGYYSDRGTGEIHKVGHLVKIDENVPLQNQYSPYKNAVFAGPIDLDSAAPITTDDHAKTQAGSEVVIDLLANDNDPDGDEISIDGIVQPENGRVFANGDGTVTYRPDLDFTGSDEFKYWAADGSGNFSSAQTSIEVVEAPMPGETDEVSTTPGIASPVALSGTVDVTQTGSDEWFSVTFEQALDTPSVVMGPISFNGWQPATVRVREVSDVGFQFQIDEWDYLDGMHVTESIGWMAVEQGVHKLANGAILEAGSSTGTMSPQPVELTGGFQSAPVVLGQATSDTGSEAIASRLDNVTATGFSFLFQEEEGGDNIHVEEAFDWIAISKGNFGDFVAGDTGDTVTHKISTIDFGSDLADAQLDELVFLADMQSFDGPDPSTIRLSDLTTTSASVFVEEEQSRDSEIRHVDEAVGWLALGNEMLFV